MTDHTPSRRDALAWFAAFGAAAPVALNLSAIGAAAAQTAGASAPYRALVCIFLQGGNDSNNLLVATDPGSFSQYWAARFIGTDPIALMPPGAAPVAIGQTSTVTKRLVTSASMPEHWGGLAPISPATAQTVPPANKIGTSDAPRTFGLHPLMPNAQAMFKNGSLALIANVGTLLAPLSKATYLKPTASTPIPQRLFSHADQQSAWQSGHVEGSQTGWGGLIGDTAAAANAKGVDFTAITTAGNTVYLAGVTTKPFRVKFGKNRATAQTITLLGSSGSYNGSNIFLQEFRAGVQEASLGALQTNFLVVDYAAAVSRSVGTSLLYDNALGAMGGAYSQVPAPIPFVDPITGKTVDNSLADQLQAVAETAAAHALLGVQRQVFFVQYGSFDTHDGQNARQGLLLAELDHALAYFDGAVKGLGLSDQITTFTASDFNRTFTSNGDGTDHAWGGHHLVMGGAVKGGDIYGAFPTAGIDRAATSTSAAFLNPDAVGNAIIPTTSVDQYLATMARWMGVTDPQLATIFPQLRQFPKSDIGFLKV